MHSLSIFIPVVLFIVGLIVISYKERIEKSKLSLENLGRLSIASSKTWFWRMLPLISIFGLLQLFKLLPDKNKLLLEVLSFVMVVGAAFGISTYFRFQALANEGVPESYIQILKNYTRVRIAMYLILPILVFMFAILPLAWAIVMNFSHPHAH